MWILCLLKILKNSTKLNTGNPTREFTAQSPSMCTGQAKLPWKDTARLGRRTATFCPLSGCRLKQRRVCVSYCSRQRHNAQGVEANIPYAEYSQVSSFEIASLPYHHSPNLDTEEKFDLITMFHVLEHLEHPLRDLSHLGKLLKPGGYFVIEVPHISCTQIWHFRISGTQGICFLTAPNPIHVDAKSWV